MQGSSSNPPYYMIPMPIFPMPYASNSSASPDTYASKLPQGVSSFPQYIPYPVPMNPQAYSDFMASQQFSSAQIDKPTSSPLYSSYKTLTPDKLRKLIKVQAAARGWYARNRIVPTKRLSNYASHRLMEDLIHDYIEDKLLIDIILEIITKSSSKPDYILNSPNERLLGMLSQSVEMTLVSRMCEEVAKDVINLMVKDYLHVRSKLKIIKGEFDPLILICNNYADLVVDTIVGPVARECIAECAFEYMHEAYSINLINQELPDIIKGIVNSAGWEVAMELFLEECFDEEIQNTVLETIPQAVDEAKLELDIKAKEKAFEIMLQRMIMEIAVNELRILYERKIGLYSNENLDFNQSNKDLIANQDDISFKTHTHPAQYFSQPNSRLPPKNPSVPQPKLEGYGNSLSDYPYAKQASIPNPLPESYYKQPSYASVAKSSNISVPNNIYSQDLPILNKPESYSTNSIPPTAFPHKSHSNIKSNPITYPPTAKISASSSVIKEEELNVLPIDTYSKHQSYVSKSSNIRPPGVYSPQSHNSENSLTSPFLISRNHNPVPGELSVNEDLEVIIYGGNKSRK